MAVKVSNSERLAYIRSLATKKTSKPTAKVRYGKNLEKTKVICPGNADVETYTRTKAEDMAIRARKIKDILQLALLLGGTTLYKRVHNEMNKTKQNRDALALLETGERKKYK